ncbi:MAG TPA: 4-hydroxyphenylpyruvate dioxygenase [Actinocrinis sp.]|uniref:4-hydroxyphenylpyruvate dioxygenase n=1 Tax=Actinocrinis sp. TaxID=1920516 RepID=UPI002DDCF8D6|nr:4-hydroxyphenylpyruvate dioxygenase [Actinocrinis sp.]HEV2342855.1 4-hydroxyphenylpyruvate dioxygenase [Actinocrinis sp.]
MNIQAIAYAEFHVEDPVKVAAHLVDGYGFTVDERYRRPDPGLDCTLLVHGGVRLVLSCAASPSHPAAEYVRRHGDGVAVVAVLCDDARAACDEAARRGARVISAEDSTIAGFGDTALRFVEPSDPALASAGDAADGLLEVIDHVAVVVPAGELHPTVTFCEEALDLRPIFSEYIEVGAQAMDSVVVQSASGAVTFTLLEPDTSRNPGQIDAYLDAHGGAGVQHLAFRTEDIATAVRTFSEREVEFLTTPSAYYDVLEERLGPTRIPSDTLRRLNVLVDQDHDGQLFQIFTRTTHPRRTFFLELIERRGAGTFGTANIKALYQAVERQNAAADS